MKRLYEKTQKIKEKIKYWDTQVVGFHYGVWWSQGAIEHSYKQQTHYQELHYRVVT